MIITRLCNESLKDQEAASNKVTPNLSFKNGIFIVYYGEN